MSFHVLFEALEMVGGDGFGVDYTSAGQVFDELVEVFGIGEDRGASASVFLKIFDKLVFL